LDRDPRNTIFYGSCLDIIRANIPNETIDLIYLDPPFYSKANNERLFHDDLNAQIQTLPDYWQWEAEGINAYDYLTIRTPNELTARLIEALYNFLGKGEILAYLAMMAVILLELHRVLKPTGSIFIYCDTTVSHYLKIVIDSIFGAENFLNEIILKKGPEQGDTKPGSKHFVYLHDSIFFYAKKEGKYVWNQEQAPYGKHKDKNESYKSKNLFDAEEDSAIPMEKIYLDESSSIELEDVLTDIKPLSGWKTEFRYPIQKSLMLVERIIKSCSNEDSLVLDPFCGYGTTIIAAEKLCRHWIGIDNTWPAINLLKDKLKDMLPRAKFTIII
jgi:DNA modification methylase